ncbi:hypothetical protein SAMN04487913_103204 [Arthrobacter sp. ok362]|nr:hypothetical protein SAMN04487913_103204 [Arthrobacter sp. ok362]
MVDRQSIERYRAATSELSGRVADELAAYFAALDLSRPEAARNALLEFMPLLVAEYGQVAETLAMDWYDEIRAGSGAAASFRVTAPAAASVTADRVEKKVRYLAGQLWTPEPAAMLAGLTIATDKYVKQSGRDTIAWNADREGAFWARVPSGAKTCSWCLILASRDAVYLSEKSAKTRSDGETYHGRCDCQAVPLRSGDDYPPGYLPDDFYDMYSVARDAAGSGDMKDIAAAMRREFPGHVTDGVHTH